VNYETDRERSEEIAKLSLYVGMNRQKGFMLRKAQKTG